MEIGPVTNVESDLWYYLSVASRLLLLAISVLGVFFCVRTYKQTKAFGFALVALYFATPIAYSIYSSFINRIYSLEIARMKEGVVERIYEDTHMFLHETIKVPIFEAMLLIGIFSIAKKMKANQSSHRTSASAPR